MSAFLSRLVADGGVVFSPLLPWEVLAGGAGLLLALVVFGLVRRMRGMGWRIIPLSVLLIAVLNPRLVVEERQPLADIVAVIVDRSDSQKVGTRAQQTDEALEALQQKLAEFSSLDVRVGTVESKAGVDEGTRLFAVLDRMLSDIPRRRLAGVIAITDGQIADPPNEENIAALGVPVHTLLTGRPDENDRRLIVESAPAFEMIDKKARVVVRVEDRKATMGARTRLSIRRDGGAVETIDIPLNRPHTLLVPVDHGGATVLDMEAEATEGELSMINNRAVVSINGIRDRLRVLLISGEPHAGERTWRNLLKADSSVDLVHFTILRPSDKSDMTPLNELALIVFPMRELFENKLKDFDLVIFDRFQGHWLPEDYYDRLARYVRDGGALLVAGAGGGQAQNQFPYDMSDIGEALKGVLPAVPTGEYINEGFLPTPSETGRRHPITAGLSGGGAEPPRWGRWMRQERAVFQDGDILLTGAGKDPLLLVRKIDDGRVGQLLSDTIWLWARGYEGGGPYSELIRRLAHWLMKEPELEEESLQADIAGNRLTVHARSLSRDVGSAVVTTPDGARKTLPFEDRGAGMFVAGMEVDSMGIYRIDEGGRSVVVVHGMLNALETADLRASDAVMKPVAKASDGGIFWLRDGLPSLRRVADQARTTGEGWIGLSERRESEVTALYETALFPGVLLLLGGLGGFLWAWRRESRQ